MWVDYRLWRMRMWLHAPRRTGVLSRAKNWWHRGSKNDAYWRSLSLKDKAYYEIGQKTLSDSTFARLGNLDPVARGRVLVAEQGWFRAMVPESPGLVLGAGRTLGTGPTPLVRWFAPRAAIGGGVAYGGWRIYSWLFPSTEPSQEGQP